MVAVPPLLTTAALVLLVVPLSCCSFRVLGGRSGGGVAVVVDRRGLPLLSTEIKNTLREKGVSAFEYMHYIHTLPLTLYLD